MLTFIVGFIFGTLIGSLVLCLAERSTSNQTFGGRSYCDKCRKTLSPIDLIPIISFFWLKGQCRNCHAKLSFWYPISEIIFGLFVGLIFLNSLPSGIILNNWLESFFVYSNIIFQVFILAVLITVFITDIKTGLIPDRITYPAVIITLLYLILIAGVKIYLLFWGLRNSDIGKFLLPPYSDYFYRHVQILIEPLTFGVVAALILGFFFGTLILVTKGRGMGGGDLKLSVFIGLILGLPLSLLGIMLAFLSGSIVGIGLICFGKKKFGQTIPFGPFMSLGALIAFFWGNQILSWYLALSFN